MSIIEPGIILVVSVYVPFNKIGGQGWHSGETTHLPPMRSGLIPRLSVICRLSLLVLVQQVFPSHQNPIFDLICN